MRCWNEAGNASVNQEVTGWARLEEMAIVLEILWGIARFIWGIGEFVWAIADFIYEFFGGGSDRVLKKREKKRLEQEAKSRAAQEGPYDS